MTTERSNRAWWRLALVATLLVAPLLPGGCGGEPDAPVSAGSPADLDAGIATGTPTITRGDGGTGAPGAACGEEGSVQDCYIDLGQYAGVHGCYRGRQQCVDGAWSSCTDGEVVNLSAAALRGESNGFLALAAPAACLNNPCDPECQRFQETPPSALRPDAGDPSIIWPGGSLEEYPGGLVNKGIREPCQWGYDCQFNRKCQMPTTGAGCNHSKCMEGLPLGTDCDPCVEAICEVDASCCDMTASGPQIDYANTCAHDPCDEGGQLKANCHDCVADVCARDPLCCEGGTYTDWERVRVCTRYEWVRRNGHWVEECTRQDWEWQEVEVPGTWDDDCVELVEEECGLLCPWGSGTVDGPGEPNGDWSESCVDMVDAVCGAECGEPSPSSCEHSICTAGAPLDALCHSCVTAVCDADPTCCITGWTASCVARVPLECGQACDSIPLMNPPPEQGLCVPWLPSQRRDSCSDGIDLGGGVVCDDALPVCNHGGETAPAGIRIVHFPGNSQNSQFATAEPDLDHSQMEECFTDRPIPPGQCLGVTTCPGLDDGNREIMINPPDPDGATTTYHVEECQMNDNWTLRSSGVDCVTPVCSGGESESVIRRVNLLLIMDKSGSMDGSKWNGAAAAIKGFARSPDSAGLHLALEFFGLANQTTGSGSNRRSINGEGCGESSCSSAPCAIPMVALGPLLQESGAADPQEQAIVNAVDSVDPDSWTPTHPALKGGLEWAIAGRTANPDDVYAVVLVTDGVPQDQIGCEKDEGRIARLSYDAYTQNGIKTYTVGMDGADIGFLDTVANAGGTGSAFVITTGGNVERELIDVFQAIHRENAQCVFTLENADAIDPYDGSVNFYSSVNGSTEPLPYLEGPELCGDGWYFDDPENPTQVLLCGNTCEVVQSDDRARLDLGFGCAKPFATTERYEVYQADCASDQGVQWGYLAYDTEIIEDSHIRIEARAAPTEAELSRAPSVTLADIGNGGSDPAVCSMFGPAPTCPIPLYPKLDMPAARYPFLQIKITMDPASDEYKAPVLNDWEITYSCGYDE